MIQNPLPAGFFRQAGAMAWYCQNAGSFKSARRDVWSLVMYRADRVEENLAIASSMRQHAGQQQPGCEP
jgi:hypothetical protein